MKCAICRKGNSLPGTVTVTLERMGTTLIVKSVPALVCDNCGEEYVDEKVTSELLQVSDKAVREGVQVDVREYVAV